MKILKLKLWRLIKSRLSLNQSLTIQALIIITLLLPRIPAAAASTETNSIRFGAPDDLGGLIADHMVKTKSLTGLEVYLLQDCCTTKSEWAMSSDELDAAIMCPDAAKKLIARDSRFEITGSCLVNSDILMVKPKAKTQTIGVTQNRRYQTSMVRRSLGADYRTRPMLSVSMPYAYAKNDIDGVVIDFLKSLYIKGEKKVISNIGDQVTYVLVVNKEFVRSSDYKKFISCFNQTVKDLKNPKILRKAVMAYKSKRLSREDERLWNRQRIRFVSIALVKG